MSEPCICNTAPSTDGPEEDCPEHGRPYSYWVARGDELAMRLARVERAAAELTAALAPPARPDAAVVAGGEGA